MTTQNHSSAEFDGLMSQWMEGDARVRAPEHLLDSVLDRTARTRRIPRWLLVERWLPSPMPTRFHAAPRLTLLVLLIALLIAAVAFALTAGGERRLPAPFGPAANGLIAYDTNAQIFVSSPGGGTGRLLVDGVPNAASATFSPDGTRMAFWGDDSPDSLYVVNADGSALRQLTGDLWIGTNMPPAWSPDSDSIAFSTESGPNRQDEAIYVVDAAAGGDPRPVGDAPAAIRAFLPAWSPDGRWIAFIGVPVVGQDGLGIWLVRPDGTGARRLPTSKHIELAQPQWAPMRDRLRIAYAAIGSTGGQDVFVLDIVSDVETLISDEPGPERYPAWSPDGDRLTWLVGNPAGSLRIAAASDGAIVATIPAGSMAQPPAWSPDGAKIYAADDARSSMTVVTVDRSAPTVVIPHPSSQGLPNWQRRAP